MKTVIFDVLNPDNSEEVPQGKTVRFITEDGYMEVYEDEGVVRVRTMGQTLPTICVTPVVSNEVTIRMMSRGKTP